MNTRVRAFFDLTRPASSDGLRAGVYYRRTFQHPGSGAELKGYDRRPGVEESTIIKTRAPHMRRKAELALPVSVTGSAFNASEETLLDMV